MDRKPIKIIKGSTWLSKDAEGGISFRKVTVLDEIIPIVIIQDVSSKLKRRVDRIDFLESYEAERR